MTKFGAFSCVVAAVVLGIGASATADDPGAATDDVTVEDAAKATGGDPAKATSDDLSKKSLVEQAHLPIGLTVGKTVLIGKTPTKFQLGFDYSLARQDNRGQCWNI